MSVLTSVLTFTPLKYECTFKTSNYMKLAHLIPSMEETLYFITIRCNLSIVNYGKKIHKILTLIVVNHGFLVVVGGQIFAVDNLVYLFYAFSHHANRGQHHLVDTKVKYTCLIWLFLLIGHLYLSSMWFVVASRTYTQKTCRFKSLDCMLKL